MKKIFYLISFMFIVMLNTNCNKNEDNNLSNLTNTTWYNDEGRNILNFTSSSEVYLNGETGTYSVSGNNINMMFNDYDSEIISSGSISNNTISINSIKQIFNNGQTYNVPLSESIIFTQDKQNNGNSSGSGVLNNLFNH